MKYEDGSEEFFKKLAAGYVEAEGGKLNRELEPEPPEDEDVRESLSNIGRGVRKGIFVIKARKAIYAAAPAAACLLILFLGLSRLLAPNGAGGPVARATDRPGTAAATGPAPAGGRAGAAPLSARLPAGCVLTGTDYDHGKTIYYIRNSEANDIILVSEPSGEKPAGKDGSIKTDINGTDAYVTVKSGYKSLYVENGGVTYTLTSEFNVSDLIEIAEALL